MPHLSRVDRVRGCLLGMAVGDALGAPLEGLSSQQIKSHYGRVRNYVERGPGVEAEAVSLEAARPLFRRHAAGPGAVRHPARARSRGPGAAGRTLPEPGDAQGGVPRRPSGYRPAASGRSWRPWSAACPPHQAGQPGRRDRGGHAASRRCPCSSAMTRIRSFESVIAASLMTHRDIRSISGAMAVVHAIRRLVDGEPRDPSLLLWVASDLVKDEKRIADEYADVVIKLDEHARCLPRTIAHAESVLDQPRGPCPDGPGRRGQPPRGGALLQASHPGIPAGMHPDVPVSPAHDRQLRGGRDRRDQPRRRRRHRRGDPGGHGGGLLRDRRDPQAMARRAARTARGSRRGPWPWPDAPAKASRSPTSSPPSAS